MESRNPGLSSFPLLTEFSSLPNFVNKRVSNPSLLCHLWSQPPPFPVDFPGSAMNFPFAVHQQTDHVKGRALPVALSAKIPPSPLSLKANFCRISFPVVSLWSLCRTPPPPQLFASFTFCQHFYFYRKMFCCLSDQMKFLVCNTSIYPYQFDYLIHLS